MLLTQVPSALALPVRCRDRRRNLTSNQALRHRDFIGRASQLAICDFPAAAHHREFPVALSRHPAKIFIVLSMVFGLAIIFATPPLRGPDETAHFLRAYGVAGGDIIPSLRDAQGRKGVLLPAKLYSEFDHFESARVKEKDAEWFGYGPVLRAYFKDQPVPAQFDTPPVFVPYGGSEGYSPIAYLPQAAAALATRAFDLDFATMSYLMRFVGLAAMTAMIAYAIAIVPSLAWTFATIALLPAALYGRSVINADGTALGAAMVLAALWLRGISSFEGPRPATLCIWMMLGALTKPTNLSLALLGLVMPTRRWPAIALVMLPAVGVAMFWTALSGADTGGWRMVEITGQPAAAFDPAAKLGHLLHDPLRFPAAVVTAIQEKDLGELWRQCIGVLGLFDTVLPGWVYSILSVLLLGSFFTRLPVTPVARGQIAAIGIIVTLAYAVLVYLICYLSFTPLDANSVWGVQGRYFVPCVPIMAMVVAATFDRGPDERLRAALAICAGMLGGSACIQAILQTDWHF